MLAEQRLTFLLATVQFTNIIDFVIMMPLGPSLMRIFHISPAQFALLVASYNLSAAASGILSSFFIDRFDRKTSLLFIYAGFILGTALCGLAASYHLLLVARFATGLFGGVMGAATLSTISDAVPAERRGSAIGILQAAFSVASAFGIPAGLWIAHASNWHIPFVALAALSVPVWLVLFFTMKPMRGHMLTGKLRPSAFDAIRHTSRNPNQLRALLLMVLMIFGHLTLVPFINPYIVKNVGLGEGASTWIYFVGGVLTMFSSPLIGRMTDRFGKAQLYTVLALLAMIPIFLLTHLPPLPLVEVLSVTALFFVFAGGRGIPISTLIASTAKPSERGGFMSLSSSIQQLAAGLASYVGGLIIVEHAGKLERYSWLGYLAIACTAVSIWVAWRVHPAPGEESPTDLEEKETETVAEVA